MDKGDVSIYTREYYPAIKEKIIPLIIEDYLPKEQILLAIGLEVWV